jgi:site-specific DNA-methyltransferase (adenine-specific)
MSDWSVLHGDCLEVLKGMADDSVDAVVTDPPYGLSFMGKRWDYDVPSVEIWAECLRVLKPGGYLLAFAGTRTQHRMAVRIEDAGFEIRDLIMWVYGSGFPKSLDVSKAIDKRAGAEREVLQTIPDRWAGKGAVLQRATQALAESVDITAPATPEARQWSGWGTALKPALEPITVARKPFPSTVAANVLEHGTGALNVDGCRVGAGADDFAKLSAGVEAIRKRGGTMENSWKNSSDLSGANPANPSGRWPANLIHDGSDEVVELFPSESERVEYVAMNGEVVTGEEGGSAARFFYCAKASKSDRDEGCEGLKEKPAPKGNHQGRDMENPANALGGLHGARSRNHHPTVKPTDLMRYLCRLVTPPGGLVLDPFAGSGSTGKGAVLEGFRFVGIEREAEYVEIARRRIAHAVPKQLGLL